MGRTRRLRYRHLRRTIIAVLATVAVILLFGLVVRLLLQAGPTRRLARSWIESAAGQRGVDLEIDGLSWGLIPPRVHLVGVRIHAQSLRAEIETARVDLARIWLTRQTIELGTVAAEGVTVRLEGLPERRAPKPSKLKVRVRQLDLHRLEFEGTGLPGRIDLDLEGTAAGWSSQDGHPEGFLRVDRARLNIPGMEPFSTAIAARLDLDGGLRIPSWTADGDGFSFRGQGAFGGAAETSLTATGTVDLETLDRIVRAHAKLTGTIEVDATVVPAQHEMLRVEVTSPRLSVAGFPVEDLSGQIVIADGGLQGELNGATFHGGRLSGSYVLDELRGNFPHRVRVIGQDVSVAGLLEDLGVPSAGLAARFDAEVELDWFGKAFPQGRGRAGVQLVPDQGPLPVAGTLHVDLAADGNLNFAADELQLGSSIVSWQGPLTIGSWQPAWSVTASEAELSEIAPMVNAWVGSTVLPPLEGRGRLQVTLSGPWNELVVNTRLDARPLRMNTIELDHLVAAGLIAGRRLTLSPSRFRIGNGTGTVEGTLTWDLAAGDDQLNLDLRGYQVPLSAFARWVGLEGLADGAFSFTGALHGPVRSPRGSWAAGLTDVHVAGLDLGSGSATIDVVDGQFELRGIEFDQGLYGRAWWRVASGEVGSDLRWPGMPLDFLGDALTRTVGTSANVALTASITTDGHPTGTLRATTEAGSIEVEAEADRWLVRGALEDALVGEAELTRTADRRLAGPGELRLTSAEHLLSRVLPDSGIPLRGTATVRLDVDWPAGATPEIEGTVTALGLDLEDQPVELLGPAHFTLSARGFEVEDLFLGHHDDRMFLRWGIGADGSIHGNATGTLDALLLRFIVPEWEPAGRATGVIEMLGSLERPRFEGIAELAEGSFRIPGSQTIISGINGTILLSEDELVVDGSTFRFMQGRGHASGRITRSSGIVGLELDGTMNGLRYEALPGLTARLSGSWQLTGPVDDLHIRGDMTVDRASLQRRDAPSAMILDWFGGTPAPPREGGPSLDLRVEADQTIELRNPFVRLVGSALLHITGTTDQPGLVGNIEFEEGGEVTLQNLRYDLERGTFTFTDPERIDPNVEIQLRTWVQNYQVTFRISGTSDRLVPQVTSNPPLPQEEVYSLIAMGYRSDALGSGAMGVGVASTLLSQQITSEIDRRTKLVLPYVRVDPFAESTTGGPAARVTVVQQLAPNWTATLQSNLSAERAEVIVSRWYLAPGIFLEASRDLDGAYGLDIKMRRPY